MTSSSRVVFSSAPTEKKNSTRKKSRSGRRLSAMYWAMGLVARATPATKPPISNDSPLIWARLATPRHQPRAIRKMNSWKASKNARRY